MKSSRGARRAWRHDPLVRRAIAALSAVTFWAMQPVALVGGTLSAVSPSGASANVIILVTGDTFDSTAANNEVTFQPAAGSAATATALSVTTLDSTRNLKRLAVRVPQGLPLGPAAIKVVNKASGAVSDGLSIEIIEISLPETASAPVGATGVGVRIQGSPNVQFPSSPRVVFGPGITVTSVVVESATSLTAVLSISTSASTGPRNPGVASALQSAIRVGAFTVTPAENPNQPPTSHPGGPYSGTAGQELSFDGSASSDPDAGDTLAYEWQFGDGGTATGATVAHTYATAGTYTASLTVRDGDGASHTQTFDVAVAAAPLGRGVIAGRVYDDLTGLPLADAAAQLLDAAGEPLPVLPVTSDRLGRFRLSAAPGVARVLVTKTGYTSSDLAVPVVEGRRVEPDDARLTPVNGAPAALSSVTGGTLQHGPWRLDVPPAAFPEDRSMALTAVSPQAPVRGLPLGWTPLGVADLAAGATPFDAAAALSLNLVPLPPGEREVVAARWDDMAGEWIALGATTRSADGASLTALLSGSGQYAVALADLPPTAPPLWSVGAALVGVMPRPPPSVQLTLDPAPRILFAQSGARSLVDAVAVPAEPLPSGTPLTVELAESYTFADGSILRPMPARRRFALHNLFEGQPSGMRVSFPVSPSRPLTPFALREGAIDLAGRIPIDAGAPHGAVFGGAGGVFTAAGGERVLVPAGAAAEDLPLDLTELPAAEFPVAMPSGFTLLRALTLDLHGTPLSADLQVSLPFGGSVPSGSIVMVARLTDVGDDTRLTFSAVAAVVDGALVTSTDPLGDGSIRLPGIREEGRYAWLLTSGDLGFVTGAVTGASGEAIAAALVETGSSPVAAISDSAGRYVLLTPAGTTSVRATNVVNDDTVVVTAQVAGALAVTTQALGLGPSPPFIVAVNPANGAIGVALGSSIGITFSEALDPATVTSEAVRLLAGQTVIPVAVGLDPGNTAVTVRPAALLHSHTQYTLSLSQTIRDRAGHGLASAFVSAFTTVDATPPAPPAPGTVVASIPGASGTSTITGSQGTADVAGVVVIRNLRTNALTTLIPEADGGFTGLVAALRGDRLELTLRDAAGNETTVAVPPFTDPDGSVVVGAEGGRVVGPGGVAADVPAGALPDGTVVRVTPISPTDLPIPEPASYAFAGGVHLELGGVVPLREIDLSIPASSGAGVDDAIVVVRPVPFGQETAWAVVDRAQLGDGRYTTASPPFPGVFGEGSYSFLRSTAGCLSYVAVNVRYGFDAFAVVAGIPFVFPVFDVNTVVVPAPCGSTLDVEITQPDTGALLERITAFAPTSPNEIVTSGELLTDDVTPPVVVQVNNPSGQQTRRVELTFSEPMDAASVCQAVRVRDSQGADVTGHVFGCPASSTAVPVVQAVFLPNVPFRFGEQYTITLTGAFDLARNPIASEPFVFTPFEPRSLSLLREDDALLDSLLKCAAGACSTSVTDQVVIGTTLLIANGARTAEEQYSIEPPRRLLAVDVSNPAAPTLIGWHQTTTNPRALAAVDNANVAGFQGDLVLVAGGGRVAGGELAAKLEVYDVSACTRRPLILPNCLEPSLSPFKGAKFLSTPTGATPRPGVPFESGVPLQISVLHQRRVAPAEDTLIAYIGVVPIGVEAVDIRNAFNAPFDETTDFAPDAVKYGDFTDIAIVRNRVLAVGAAATSGAAGVRVFSAQLDDVAALPPPVPPGLSRFEGAARVATAQDVVFDLDGDGNLGLAEDQDGDPLTGLQEVFDLAVVASGPLTEGCLGAVPCGELYVIDVSSLTALRPGVPAVLTRIPLPGPAFAVQIDGPGAVAYVEIRGRGLGIVDLSHLQRILRGEATPAGAWDANVDGVDDRLLRIVARTDIFASDLEIDTSRGLAFLNGSSAGPQVVQVSVNCTDLALDFKPKPAGTLPSFDQEKAILVQILNGAATRLLVEGGFGDIGMLEQGSGSCFWRPDFPRGCTSFIPGTSDHDIEVFVPQPFVEEAQEILDRYMEGRPAGVEKLGALTLFAVAREPFENAELLNGTPMNRSGDPAGDLAMGRQLLMLLWLLEGEYVAGLRGTMPNLEDILERLRRKHVTDPVFPGEPSGIPRLEGYEWSLLQEFNFFKSGAMVRIRNACGGEEDAWADIARGDDALDRSANFDEDDLRAGCQEELHVVAKAAIRAVLARLAADDAANPLILDIDRSEYGSDACLTGVADPRRPPADPLGYTAKRCDSFEEYIVSVAVRSVKAGHGVFAAGDLPRIFTFYCAKVGENCANREGQKIGGFLFNTDGEANQFIADSIAFIGQVQGQTFEIYIQTLDNDIDPVGDLPFLQQIVALCAAHGIAIGAAGPRADVRRCNRAIVSSKTNGDPNAGEPAKRLGARNFVRKNLRVRALNLGARTVDVPVAMYEGDGVERTAYSELKRVVLARFGGGEVRFVEDEPDPDDPRKRRAAFPAAFDLTALAPGIPRAITFFIDPEGTIPEANRRDNAAGFFYYLLGLQDVAGPGAPDEPELPTDAIDPDPLCVAGPKLDFEIRAFGAGNTSHRGARELSLEVGQTVQVMYRVRNVGDAEMRDVTVRRGSLEIGIPMPEIAPGKDGVWWETLSVAPGVGIVRATATAFDGGGNTLPPAVDAIRISGSVPSCEADIQSLDPDPNPQDGIGLPLSTVMRGGKLVRYYRVIRNGQPMADTLVTLRVVRPNGTENLYVSRTNANGLLTHVPLGGDDDPRGLAIEAAQIGAPGESATVHLEAVDGASTVCAQSFTAQVTERDYSRALKAGASLEVSGAIVGLNVKAKPGIGFEYKVDGDTGSGDRTAAFSRLMSTTASLGLKGTAAKTKVHLLETASMAEVELAVAANIALMLRDRHAFDLVDGALNDEQKLVVAHLVAGLLFNSTLAGAAGPAGPLLALVVSELHEQLAGLSTYRESVGASAGYGGTGSGDLKGPTLSFEKFNIPILKHLGFTIGAEGSGEVSASINIDLGSDVTVSGEYRQEFDLSAKLKLSTVKVETDEETQSRIAKGVKAIQDMLDASGTAAGTIKITLVGGVAPLTLKRIVISISHKKKYGLKLVGQDLIDEGSGDMRTLKFTISDPRKFPRVLQSIATIRGINLALSGVPAQVALAPTALADEIVGVLAECDGFEETIERGQAHTVKLGLEALKLGTGGEGVLEVKFDLPMTSTLRRGAVTGSDLYTLEHYPAHDDAFPSRLGEELIETVTEWATFLDAFLRGKNRIVQAVAVIDAIRYTLGLRFSPSGVDLDIDGTAEPQPLTVDLVGFKYKPEQQTGPTLIRDSADVTGPADGPHYGVGGFFNFSPIGHQLAAPAPLTIYWEPHEIVGFDEQTLGIYRWNDDRRDWDFLGGTVDPAGDSVTVSVDRLGLYTAAPPMPSGSLDFDVAYTASGTDAEPTTTVTFTSTPIQMNTGAGAPDGTIFTVRALVPNATDAIAIGEVLTPDADSVREGVQVASQGGRVQFTVALPGSVGNMLAVAYALHGTALGERTVTYQRPQ